MDVEVELMKEDLLHNQKWNNHGGLKNNKKPKSCNVVHKCKSQNTAYNFWLELDIMQQLAKLEGTPTIKYHLYEK